MSAMTEQRALIARVSADFSAISQYMARVSADLSALDRLLSEQPPYPVPYGPQYQYPPQVQPPAAPPAYPAYPAPPVAQKPPRDEGWIGKLLAVAGVAVTLIGVVLLVVLAAQAGI
jgi:hypothetical protein